MEEDIKILENIKKFVEIDFKHYITDRELKAIENLIKGYRELEEKNKYWNDRIEYAKKDTKGLKMYEMGMAWEDMKEDLEKSIPKSKVKEKIEELEKEYKQIEETSDFIIADTIQPKIEVLKELMEE